MLSFTMSAKRHHFYYFARHCQPALWNVTFNLNYLHPYKSTELSFHRNITYPIGLTEDTWQLRSRCPAETHVPGIAHSVKAATILYTSTCEWKIKLLSSLFSAYVKNSYSKIRIQLYSIEQKACHHRMIWFQRNIGTVQWATRDKWLTCQKIFRLYGRRDGNHALLAAITVNAPDTSPTAKLKRFSSMKATAAIIIQPIPQKIWRRRSASKSTTHMGMQMQNMLNILLKYKLTY